ncbi:MAG: AI-2E family transporter [Prevotella sp.]|nr:AI-2E family transporter [Bacteroidaceae bacterium]
MLEKEITFDKFIRGLLIFAGIVCIILFINYLESVLTPFFIAWFIAYLIYPVVHFFQYKLHLHSRILSILVTLAIVGTIVYAFCAFTFPQVASEVTLFKDSTMKFISSGSNNKSISPQVEKFITEQARLINWDKVITQKNVISVIREAVPKVWDVVYQTANVLITFISSCIAILYLFFILCDYEKLSSGVMKLFPKKNRKFFVTLSEDLQRGMNRYFRGQAIIALCVGILFSVGFVIIHFPLAIPLGLFIGALSFVPYLHALGLIPAVLFSLIKAADTGQNFWVVLLSALAVFLVVQIIQDTILTPRIMGNAMGLPPFLILLALSVWGYLLGIIGMIIALPVTTLIISYYRRYITKDIPLPPPDETPSETV